MQVVSITNLLTSPTTLLFGFLVDRWGHRISFSVLSSVLVSLMHLLLGFTDVTPWVGLTGLGKIRLPPPPYHTHLYVKHTYIQKHIHIRCSLSNSALSCALFACAGIAYGLYSAIAWPSFPRVVSASRTGMAYGVATATMNTALALLPLLVAQVRVRLSDSSMEMLFASVSVLSTCISISLFVVDQRNGNKLQTP